MRIAGGSLRSPAERCNAKRPHLLGIQRVPRPIDVTSRHGHLGAPVTLAANVKGQARYRLPHGNEATGDRNALAPVSLRPDAYSKCAIGSGILRPLPTDAPLPSDPTDPSVPTVTTDGSSEATWGYR